MRRLYKAVVMLFVILLVSFPGRIKADITNDFSVKIIRDGESEYYEMLFKITNTASQTGISVLINNPYMKSGEIDYGMISSNGEKEIKQSFLRDTGIKPEKEIDICVKYLSGTKVKRSVSPESIENAIKEAEEEYKSEANKQTETLDLISDSTSKIVYLVVGILIIFIFLLALAYKIRRAIDRRQ